MLRLIEFFLALIILLILSPFFLIISILLLLTGEHKVFYLQERIGYKNKKFKIIKFATMLSNSPNMGTGSITLKNDPRVLPIGKILRKTKVNELPQIFNVIKGDLSFVGPRPQMEVDFLKYSPYIQNHIYNVRPGITGIGSIIFRDEESLINEFCTNKDPHIFYEEVIAPYKGTVELWYQENKSINTYLKLIFLTLVTIINANSKLHIKIFKDLPKLNIKKYD